MATMIKPLIVAAFLLSEVVALSTITTRTQWQDELLLTAKPLAPTPFSAALATLERDGVVRIDGRSVDPDLCTALRDKILGEVGKDHGMSDKKYIPGTRLRFDDPIDLAFGGDARHDLLLPLHNFPRLQPVLQSATSQLELLLEAAAKSLLPRLHGSGSSQSSPEGLEVVEVASLIVRPGSAHQQFHGDYRRFHQADKEEEPLENTKARMGKLPPRLVTFVALQDVPTKEHGATGFVTGTNNAEAHALVYEGNGIGVNEESSDKEVDAAIKARKSILDVSSQGVVTASGFCKGDMLIYDASVLHWGGANSVPNNDRAKLYFGVAHPGAALMCCDKPQMDGYEMVPPIMLRDVATPRH